MKLRIKFSKEGSMIFVGHLDLMRYFQKAMRRAFIDITYTSGFSPHPVMSFAAPLGVGLYSNGEYMDIEVDSAESSDSVKGMLNAVMAEGITILDVKRLPDGAGNAMASVAAASYTVQFRKGYEPEFDIFDYLDTFLSQSCIQMIKRTKKGEKELDLKPFIFQLTGNRDHHSIYMMVDASSSGNIKPTMVMSAIYEFIGYKTGEFDFIITREDTFTNANKEYPDSFVSLNAVGDDF